MMVGRWQWLREWSILIPLLLILGAVYWLDLLVRPLPQEFNGKSRHDPDYIISNFSAITLNEKGTPRYVLRAKKMEHFPDNDNTHLEELSLSSSYRGQPPVYITSRQGEISSNGSEVFLHDEVKIVRSASETQSEMTLVSTYLHAVPDLGLMDTDRPIIMSDAYNVTQAVGMTYDNKIRVMKLLAQIRSQHEIFRH
jgi:lipopolysaccharide export system protein LptC